MDSTSRASVGGALMSDIRTDISIIFQKRNSKSMVQVALKGKKKHNFLFIYQAVWPTLQKNI